MEPTWISRNSNRNPDSLLDYEEKETAGDSNTGYSSNNSSCSSNSSCSETDSSEEENEVFVDNSATIYGKSKINNTSRTSSPEGSNKSSSVVAWANPVVAAADVGTPAAVDNVESIFKKPTNTPLSPIICKITKCNWCTNYATLLPGKKFCQQCNENLFRECARCRRPFPHEKYFDGNNTRCNSCFKKLEKERNRRALIKKEKNEKKITNSSNAAAEIPPIVSVTSNNLELGGVSSRLKSLVGRTFQKGKQKIDPNSSIPRGEGPSKKYSSRLNKSTILRPVTCKNKKTQTPPLQERRGAFFVGRGNRKFLKLDFSQIYYKLDDDNS